jgi:hypothetical protein
VDGLVIDLGGALDQVIVGGRTAARAPRTGNVPDVLAAAAALRDAVEPPSGESPTMPARSTPPAVAAVPSRRTSRAAAIRAARAAQQAPSGADAQAAAAITPLPDELAAMVTGWVPQSMDEQSYAPISAAVAAAVTVYRPGSAVALRNARSIVVPFAWWVHGRAERSTHGDLQPAELTVDGLVDAYLAGPLAGQPDASRATVRSVLRRVVRNLAPETAAERIAYQPVQPPYTPADCARLVTLARQQPTDALRRDLSAMVALGAGAGLGAEDQRLVAPCHIREVDLGEYGLALAIDVPGPRARTVIVRAEYEPLLREALDLHAKAHRGRSTPLCGVKPDRRNGANRVAARAVTASGTGVQISAARLRATWLVACMSSAVPLGALLHASGLRTPRTLTDLLPYCPPASPEAVAGILRRLDSGQGGSVAS